MKNIRFRQSLSVTLLFIALIGHVSSAAEMVVSPNSPKSLPIDYSSKRVLVFRNKPSWDRKQDFEQVLTEHSVKYEVRDSSMMGSTDLKTFDLVIIPGQQADYKSWKFWNPEFYKDFQSNAAQFDNYVKAGGILIFETNGAEREKVVLPAGADIVSFPDFNNVIVLPEHPIMASFKGKKIIRGKVASHGYFAHLPSDTLIITTVADINSSDGRLNANIEKPTFIEYPYNTGRVIAAFHCFHDQDKSERGPLMWSTINYALGKEWISGKL